MVPSSSNTTFGSLSPSNSAFQRRRSWATWQTLQGTLRFAAMGLVAAGLLGGAYLRESDLAADSATQMATQAGEAAAFNLGTLMTQVAAVSHLAAAQTSGTKSKMATVAALIELSHLLPQAQVILLLDPKGKLLGSSRFLVQPRLQTGLDTWFRQAAAAAPETTTLLRAIAVQTPQPTSPRQPETGNAASLIVMTTREDGMGRIVAIVFDSQVFLRLLAPPWLSSGVTLSVTDSLRGQLLAGTSVDADQRPPSLNAPRKGTAATRPFDVLAPLAQKSITAKIALPTADVLITAIVQPALTLHGALAATLRWLLWLGLGLVTFAVLAVVGRSGRAGEMLADRQLRASESERRDAIAAQQDLRDQIEAMRRARNRILASVGHDVRTPIASILGLTSMLLDSDLHDEDRRSVSRISTSAETLLAMLSGLLDIASGDRGAATLMIEETNVGGLLHEVAEVLDTQAREKGLQLTTAIADDVAGIWRTDPTRLRQTLFNLIGNAIRYTAAGRVEVALRAGTRTPETCAGNPETLPCRRLQICVNDTGPGIPKADQERIFLAFDRGSNPGHGQESGLGLGLAICRDNATLMGGSLMLESTPGVGSEFSFEFQAEPVTLMSVRGPTHGLSAIVVGFADAARRQIVVQLERSGCLVETAADGYFGLAQFERGVDQLGGVDLLIVDDAMSGMSADTFARRLGSAAFARTMRVVCVGGQEGGAGALGVLQNLGLAVYETAADDPASIAEAVRQALQNWSQPRIMEPDASSAPESRILVVEDDPAIRSLLRSLLRKQDFSVLTADNGEDAVRIAARSTFQAILMDIQLPGIDGFEATRRIRAMPGWQSQVPILALTAITGSLINGRSRTAGMSGIIEKPVDPKRLADMVRQQIERSERLLAMSGQADVDSLRAPPANTSEDSAADDICSYCLAAVIQDLGPRRAQMALERYIADTGIRIERLSEMLPTWECDSIQRLCQQVRRWSETFGAAELAEQLERIMEAVTNNDREAAHEAFDQIEAGLPQLGPSLIARFQAVNRQQSRTS